MSGNNGQTVGPEFIRVATDAMADLETRKRMCAAEIHAVLEKYGMVALGKETRINGQLVQFELLVEAKQNVPPQSSRIAVPQR